jgi:phage/plasmid primase-like uncharacterized protein
MIDSALIERARAVPIEIELERRGIRLRDRKKWLEGPCPKCGGTDRFAVNRKDQWWNCRGCSVGGDVIDLVRHMDGCTFSVALEALTGRAGTTRPDKVTPITPGDPEAESKRALHSWHEAQPVPGTLAEIYLREGRGIFDLPPDHDESLCLASRATRGAQCQR